MKEFPKPELGLLNEFNEWLNGQRFASRTVSEYMYSIKKIGKDTRSLTIREYLGNEDLPGLRGKVYSYKAYLKFLCQEKEILSYEDYIYASNYIKGPKGSGSNRKVRKWAVKKDEWKIVISKAPNRVAKMGIWLGLQFGLRKMEILRLRVQDIDFDDKELIVREHRSEGSNLGFKTKNRKQRSLPITENQDYYLNRWINEYRKGLGLNHDYLLWNERGVRKYEPVIDRTFDRWCNSVGIRSHVLRYSFATHWYEQSKDIELIRRLLGHASIETTRKYLQLDKKETLQKARDLFEKTN